MSTAEEVRMKDNDFPLDLFFFNLDDFDIAQEKSLYDQKIEVVTPVGVEITAASLLPKLEELPMLQLLESPPRFSGPPSASCPPSIAGSPPRSANAFASYQLPSPQTATATSQILSTSHGSSPPKSMSPRHKQSPKPYQSQPSSPRHRSPRTSIYDDSGVKIPRYMRPSHIQAEHRRRCKIQNGYDDIKTLVPAIKKMVASGGKESKAGMLTKTADYCRQLRAENKELQKQTDKMREEISQLTAEISEYQNALPTSGVELAKPNQPETTRKMFNDYVQARVLQNWKFWIFSMVARPLFETFNERVKTDSMEEFNRSVTSWTEKHCSLVALRPAMLNCLRQLSTQSSVMSTPERLPEEALQATMNTILKAEERMKTEESNSIEMGIL